jgi:hypothetical protein
MSPLLFFVDDHEHGFWTLGDWAEATWPAGWETHTISWETLENKTGDPVTDIANAISEEVNSHPTEEFFVVSDSRFGHWHGGGRLLEELLQRCGGRLLRGVVYSTNPKLPSGLPPGRFLKFETGTGPSDSAAIRSFLETGLTPEIIAESMASRVLSMAIHSLEDLAYPIRLDAETLAGEPEKYEEIRLEYFQGTTGYLVAEKPFPSGNGEEGRTDITGLEQRIIQVVEREVDGSSARAAVARFHRDERSRQQWKMCSEVPPECARLVEVLKRIRSTAASGGLRDQSALAKALREVVDHIDDITGHLRATLAEVRKEVPS